MAIYFIILDISALCRFLGLYLKLFIALLNFCIFRYTLFIVQLYLYNKWGETYEKETFYFNNSILYGRLLIFMRFDRR